MRKEAGAAERLELDTLPLEDVAVPVAFAVPEEAALVPVPEADDEDDEFPDVNWLVVTVFDGDATPFRDATRSNGVLPLLSYQSTSTKLGFRFH